VEEKSNSLPILNLALIAAIVVWVALKHGAVGTLRPSAASSTTNAGVEFRTNQVLARLWQDPFEALPALTNKAAKSQDYPSSPRFLTNEIRQSHLSNNIAVLAVMFPGTPYPEDAELRRRRRYALQVAVLSANFGPRDPNYIEYDQFNFDESARSAKPCRFSYEWFAADNNPSNEVLALWLDEADFLHPPLERLHCLLTNIDINPHAKFTFFVLGPSPDLLYAMAFEPNTTNSAKIKNQCHILSTCATTANAALLGRSWLTKPDPQRKELQARLKNNLGEVELHNWVATDDQLGQLIAEEIHNRMDGAMGPSDRVVIVTEQDTFYGRNLQDAVTFPLTNTIAPTALGASTNNVWQLSYLRGLDGFKPPSGQQTGQAAETPVTPEALLKAALEKNENQSEGDPQLDYAARLGDFLRSEDRRLRHEGGRIVAVGLTGNDIYDKLSLLQALRQQLPAAVFFTTRLDSRYWSRDAISYTRGLLVASGYGLDPEPDQPSDRFIPFRDVDQTGIYRATLAAVTRMTNANASLEVTNNDLHGRLYVVGRDGPVLLSHEDQTLSWIDILRPVAAGAVGGLLIPVLFNILRFRALRAKRLFFPVGLGALVGLLFAGANWVAGQTQEEPWSFLRGVSMWPCEFVRLSIVVLGLGFFPLARNLFHRHLKELQEKVLLNELERDPKLNAPNWARLWTFSKSQWAGIRSLNKQLSISSWSMPWIEGAQLQKFHNSLFQTAELHPIPTAEPPRRAVDAGELLKGYFRRAGFDARFCRITFWFVGFFFIVFALTLLTGQGQDRLFIRGHRSHLIDTCVVLSAVLVFLAVLFYVVDAIRLASRFLERLGGGRTVWPLKVLLHHAAAKGIRMEHLDGWLDVKCAVVKTREAWKLMLVPFVLLFLLAGSRNSYFDRWTWPWILVAIFAAYFCIVVLCWHTVRRMARLVRKSALKELEEDASMVRSSGHAKFWAPTSEGTMAEIERDVYLKRLNDLRDEIKNNKSGAFAHWVQDPAYLAFLIPTGSTGILAIMAQYFLKQ
jgi:hypothetical protein